MFEIIKQRLNEQTIQMVEFNKKNKQLIKLNWKKYMRPKWLKFELYY